MQPLSDRPRISVLMSVYNGEKYVANAVDSILNQTYTDIEFIVIDDGSSDTTLKILAEYKDPRLKLIGQKNVGLTKALNRGIKIATGEYLARQDADDVSSPRRFEEQVAFLDSNPRCALVGTLARIIDEDGEQIGIKRTAAEPAQIAVKLPEENQFIHGSIMLRREAIVEMGGYREAFKYAQDYDLVLRLSERHQLANIDEEYYSLRHREQKVSLQHSGLQAAYAVLARDLWRQRREGECDALDAGGSVETLLVPDTGHDNMYYHRHIVYLSLRHGNMKKARRAIHTILENNPFQLRPYFHLCLTFLSKSMTQRLLALWENLLYGQNR